MTLAQKLQSQIDEIAVALQDTNDNLWQACYDGEENREAHMKDTIKHLLHAQSLTRALQNGEDS